MIRPETIANRAAVLLDAPSLLSHGQEFAELVATGAASLVRDAVEVVVLDTALPVGRSQAALPVARDLGAALDSLAARGMGPGLAVLIAAAHTPTGQQALRVPRLRRVDPSRALATIGAFREARVARRVPEVDPDPAWTVPLSADPLRRRVDEAIATLGAGGFGTRGAVEEDVPGRAPLTLAAGVYHGDGDEQRLLPGPVWTDVTLVPPPAADQRLLDLRTGVLSRTETDTGASFPMRSLRFASVARPGLVALRAEAAAGRIVPGPLLRGGGIDTIVAASGREIATSHGDAADVVADAVETGTVTHGLRTVERIAAYRVRRAGPRAPGPGQHLDSYTRRGGFDRLLREQRAAWAARWDRVDVEIPAEPQLQRAVRFALFQLQCNAAPNTDGESAVGARGLSGVAYRGHVFWDADCFVLPAMLAIAPESALAMLEYRLRRLPQARHHAQAGGRSGARFPWESAGSGEDVTPDVATVGEQLVAVRTGTGEEHITADVAWAAHRYLSWTGDKGAAERLRPLLIETAQYWAGRIRVDAGGAGHIEQVIGPDEYHVGVDDNAFTNIMARWNLRAGATELDRLAGQDPAAASTAVAWRGLAGRLVDGYDARSGRHEQFAGYHRLVPLLAAEVGNGPVAADALLGVDRVAASQLVKQPDVLMAHQLLPGELPAGSLAADLDYYAPRTAHGSSLSPATVAGLLARAGRPDDGLPLLRHAANLDLHDHSGMTAGGLHLANLAATWLALLGGICGVDVRDGLLQITPTCPRTGPRSACGSPRWAAGSSCASIGSGSASAPTRHCRCASATAP